MMERHDSELLVDLGSHFVFGITEELSHDSEYNIDTPKENLVQDSKKVSTPEHEGNVNCAMDLLAPDQSSVSSTNSRLSSLSALGQPLHSSSSEPKDNSDSDRGGHFKVKLGTSYVTLRNEHEQLDTVNLADGSSTGDAGSPFGHMMCSPVNTPPAPTNGPVLPGIPQAKSSHFPSSNITFPFLNQPKMPSTKQWTVFDREKETASPNAAKPKIFPVRPPPAIPDRKSLRDRKAGARSSPIALPVSPVPSPSADLLSMDADDLMFHLSDTSSPLPPAPNMVRPAIPPRRNLFSTSSVTSTSGSHTDISDHDLITLPEPDGHINRAHLSSASSSPVPTIILTNGNTPAPPVPPRKNVSAIRLKMTPLKTTGDKGVVSDFDAFSRPGETAGSAAFSLNTISLSPAWVNFDDAPSLASNLDCSPSANLLSDMNGVSSNEGSIALRSAGMQSSSDKICDIDQLKQEEEDSHWRKPSSSPDVRSSATKKKGTGGIGYLSLENDDCDILGSSDNLDGSAVTGEGVTVLLPVNDLSPDKSQSQWATFQNEEDEEENGKAEQNLDTLSCGANSLGMNSSGFAGSLNDGDLEDDFGLGINRLSTEMSDLKGFNRADKGSQNNLVDFSDDRGSVVVSTGSHEDDVETFLDLTAQGDSLKRKRPKGSRIVDGSENITDGVFVSKCTDSDSPTLENKPFSFHVGPAGVDDSVFVEEDSTFDPFTVQEPQKSRFLPTPVSSHSSRAGTPAMNPVGSATSCMKSSASTNPFWSPSSTTSCRSSASQSSTDSPFDNIVFNSPKPMNMETVSSKQSLPISSPVTPAQLFRIPPPPLSGSRSSTRARGSSLVRERTRNFSHGSTSAKKLDLDYSSDPCIKPQTLPPSRAKTPIQFTIKSPPKVVEPSPGPVSSFTEDVFDPFSNQNVSDLNNSFAADTNSVDLFSWMDESSADGNVAPKSDSQPQQPDEKEDVTLVLDHLDVSNNTQKNTNTNAHNHSEDIMRATSELAPINSETTTPDPLLELTKDMSVESPLSMQTVKNVLLPEVELVDSESSWDVFMRFPPTKRAMSNRKWVPIHIKLVCNQVDHPTVKMYYTAKAPEPFRTVSLESHQMQLSKPKLQAHYSDEGQVLGKLHAVKLMIVQYQEKQTFSPRRSLSRNASGFKHSCRGKQSIKFGFNVHYNVISFCKAARDAMFSAHKRLPKSKVEDHMTTVKYHSRDEFLIDVQDELQAIVHESGVLEACKVRVHFFASSFLSGDPLAKITINDRKMEGKEVVRREDIIPTSLEGWIDVQDPELHECCTSDSHEEGGVDNVGACTLYPPDACRFELMRFATSYSESELPVIVKSAITVKGARLQLRCILRMSVQHSANRDPLTQIACEDVMIRFPVPDEWGPFFRADGRFRNHSVRAKRAAKPRRKPSAEAGVTMEASVGVAKYEKAYSAIVWRLPRLPEKNAVQNTPHVFTCRIELNSDRDLQRLRKSEDSTETRGDGYQGGLDEKYEWCEVEYTMAGPTASHVCVRSICLPNTDRAEKFVSYQSHYFYKTGISIAVEPAGAEDEENPAEFCSVQ